MIFYLRPVNVREEDDYRLQSFSYPRWFSIYSYYRMLEFFNMNHIVWIILYEISNSDNNLTSCWDSSAAVENLLVEKRKFG